MSRGLGDVYKRQTNYQTEIPEYFEIGKEIETFSSQEELIDKISFYLVHDEERKKIAENGYELAKREYSLDVRIEEMLSRI